jgi:hypothetical protein
LAIRTPAASLASASNWIFTFLVVEITPVSIKSIEWRTYIYFAGKTNIPVSKCPADIVALVFNAFFIPLIYFFYPETQNLSLEQIDKLFTGDKVLLHWKASMDTTELSHDSLAGTFAEKTDVKHIDEKESL